MTKDEAREIDRLARSRNETKPAAGCIVSLVIGAALWFAAFWTIAQARAWWGAHVG